MNINVKLDKNFMTAYNRMSEKYGEEMAYLNGFGDKQLSYTDFIDNFIDKDTVADVSVDGNSNVSNKDMRTLMNEMPKSHRKLLAFNKIFYELNKKYGFKVANEWLEAEWTKALYMHDADTSTFLHYCVKPEECCYYLLDGKTYYANFKQIYNLLKEEEEVSAEGVFYKKPKNLSVRDDKGWTKVRCISKKETPENFYYVKGANGFDIITTENHKFIQSENPDKKAKELTLEDDILTYSPEMFTDSINVYNNLPLTEDIGWLIGMYLAEGYNQRGQLTIYQYGGVSNPIYNKVVEVCQKNHIPYKTYEEHGIRLKNGEYNWEKKFLTISKGAFAWEKCLCEDFIHFNKKFLNGILAGIIDGDGTVSFNKKVLIRMTSRTLINQIKAYGLANGVYFAGNAPYIQKAKGVIQQKHIIYSANADMNQNKEWFLSLPSLKVQNLFSCFEYDPKFSNGFVFNTGEVPVKNAQIINEADNVVYDLSTDSHRFVCNGILIHNCFAYDLKDVAEKGLFFLNTFNSEPPKHLSTFIDFVKEFISFCSNRSSGAVGLPNIIPYMYYFWKKDCENGYATKSPEYYAKQQIQRFVYAINQPYTRDGIQSAFINCSVFDMPYLEALFGGATFPDGEPMLDSLEEIQDFQKMFMEEVAEIRHHNVMTFPVLTISLLRKNGKFLDEDFAKWGIEHNRIWSDSNLFIDDNVSSLSNCCRLKSDVRDLGYFNSIGGTALKVGSVKVSTLNLARLALEYHGDEEAYLTNLKKLVRLDCQVLDVVRHILKRNVEKGLLPNFTKGIVDFEHLYNTVGVIGVYETMKTFGYTYQDELGNTFYSENADRFGEKIFKTIHEVKDDFMKDKDYKINLEQIPGESAAAKLLKADRFFYPETVVEDLPLYGNQFIPLGIKTTMAERIRIASLFDSFCNGGSIAHLNIDKPFDSFDKAWEMVNYIADKGLTYFAFNTRIQACAKNHGFYGKVCPICGGPVENEYTRIVGFYTPIKSWSKERKAEFKLREWEHV